VYIVLSIVYSERGRAIGTCHSTACIYSVYGLVWHCSATRAEDVFVLI
jgi:hypothetical protein